MGSRDKVTRPFARGFVMFNNRFGENPKPIRTRLDTFSTKRPKILIKITSTDSDCETGGSHIQFLASEE